MSPQTVIDNTIWTLRKASKKSKAPIWRALEEEIAGPRANRREINLDRLEKITRPDEIVVVPGKVLGNGSIGHRLTICSLSISEGAAKKVRDSGGKVVTFDYLIDNHSDGSGVRIIG